MMIGGLCGLFRGARHPGLLGSNKTWRSKGGALDLIIEHLAYDPIEDKFDLDIFTTGQVKKHFNNAREKLQRHIYDYVLTDSNIEREFVKELDTCTDLVVYAKLPRGLPP